MKPITIRNILKHAIPSLAGITGGVLLALGLVGYNAVFAQPGITPNRAFLRGAALGASPALVCNGLDPVVNCNIATQGGGTLLLNGVAIPGISGGAGTFASLTVNPGPLNVTGTTNLSGPLFAIPGTSVTLERVGGLVLANSSTNTTTTLVATEQDLFSFSLLGNSLSADNQFLVLTFRDRNAATANTKQLRVRFGATVIGDSTAVAANNNWWNGDCIIWRTGAATQKAICGVLNAANAASWSTAAGAGANISTPAEVLSGAVLIRVTGTDAVAAGGSNLEGVNLVWHPAGQ